MHVVAIPTGVILGLFAFIGVLLLPLVWCVAVACKLYLLDPGLYGKLERIFCWVATKSKMIGL
jgi:hypothetical protein